MRPVLQLALDFVDLKRAIKVAEAGLAGGVDWLEAGTPLIKSEGLNSVRELRRLFPNVTIVADMKVMDAGRTEVEAAAKAGADIVDVLGAATPATIQECIRAGKNYGAKIAIDLIAISDPVKRAVEAQQWGADFVIVHCSIDEQMEGKEPFGILRKVAEAVSLPVGVAGGINSESVSLAMAAGASITIVGGAITKATNPKEAAFLIKKALRENLSISTNLFKRATEKEISETLSRISAANLSDALYRGGVIPGLRPLFPGIKMFGPVLTVRTFPGDWAKPVEAIDLANKGDIIVIDAGGVGPAVWGELATQSAIQKGIAGVVVNGAIRDTYEISQLKFPAYTRLVMPNAGEPKGLGEIGVSVNIGPVKLESGDWIIGDDDGLVALPKAVAVEYVNRAMDILEKENRLRTEIQEGGTLGSIAELLRWEKKA